MLFLPFFVNFLNLINYLDVSIQVDILLTNLKSIIDKLQLEKDYFKTQIEKLKIEKNKLVISNKNLSNKITILEESLQKNVSL